MFKRLLDECVHWGRHEAFRKMLTMTCQNKNLSFSMSISAMGVPKVANGLQYTLFLDDASEVKIWCRFHLSFFGTRSFFFVMECTPRTTCVFSNLIAPCVSLANQVIVIAFQNTAYLPRVRSCHQLARISVMSRPARLFIAIGLHGNLDMFFNSVEIKLAYQRGK